MATEVHTTAPPATDAGSASRTAAAGLGGHDANEQPRPGFVQSAASGSIAISQPSVPSGNGQHHDQPDARASTEAISSRTGHNEVSQTTSGAVQSSTLGEDRLAYSSSSHSRQEGHTSVRSGSASKKSRRNRDDEVPACLLKLRDGAQACNHRAQAWAEAQDEKAMQKQQRRRDRSDGGVQVDPETGAVTEPKGDPLLQRKGMVVTVSIILIWVYIVFVWRICARGIQRHTDAITSRTEGIGFLVGFHVLWLLAIWSYVRVFTTPPGFVRDHVPISDPPQSPSQPSSEHTSTENVEANDVQEPAEPLEETSTFWPSSDEEQQHDQQQSLFDALNEPNEPNDSDERALDPAKGVDSSTAAFVGPVGAAKIARQEEADAIQNKKQEQSGNAQSREAPGLLAGMREPSRQPPSGMPLHPANMYCYRCRRVKPPRAHHCRHCGTCVLKMDHHCPWTGGCVGAQNHKYFFNFLQWVSLLEIFVLIVNAYLFARGISRRSGGRGEAGWPIDGYMISLFPITAMFTLFTSLLTGMHAYLFVFNLTTIEHLLFERFKTREGIDIDHYLDNRSRALGEPKMEWTKRLKEAKKRRQGFAQYWGSLKTDTNQWWLDGRHRGPVVGLHGHSIDATSKKDFDDAELKQSISWWRAIPANWRENMGDNPLGWFLPMGRARNANGYEYESNWRFGAYGQWTPREQWPQRWREMHK